MQVVGRGQQAAQAARRGQARQHQEHGLDVGRQRRVGAEQADVGVQAGGTRVVVAGGEVRVAPQHGRAVRVTGLAPRDEQHLRVRLQPDNAVDHLRAHALQPLRPVDVGLLVEAGLELQHDGDLLAAAHGLHQQVHDRALVAGAIDRLPDGQHLWVLDGLTQEFHHRLEALERVVQEQVAAAQAGEDRGAEGQVALRPAGLEGREAQRRRLCQIDQLVQAHQVDRAVDAVQRRLGQRELLQQQGRELGRATADDLEPDRLTVLARRETGTQGLAQVQGLVLVDFQVRVARDAELREALHPASGQQFVQVRADHAGEQHEALLAQRHEAVGQADDARQRARHLDDDDGAAGGVQVIAGELQDEVQALVGHQREGVRRVQGDRHQQRPDLGFEESGHPAPLGRAALGVVQDADAAFGQGGHDLLVEQAVLLVDQLVRLARDGGEGAARSLVGRRADDLQVIRKAHLEELVQVGRDDGDVAQALKQGHVGSRGLGEHTAVESEEREFSVDHSNCCTSPQ